MGWRGTLRSVAAASRAAQREADRHQRANAKMQMVSSAYEAVSEWENLLASLVSIHADRTAVINWQVLADCPSPTEPIFSNAQEALARAALGTFKPRRFDFLFGGSEKRRQVLIDAVKSAQDQDRQTFATLLAKYQSDLAEWRADAALARRLLAGEPEALREVLVEMQSLSSVGIIGSTIEFHISDASVHAVAHIHSDEIVPKVRRKQLASGRLSESKMPAGEFNELYQDYVCSAALRIGGDLLSLLPLPEVYVTCAPMMLDRKSGHQRRTPVLSIQLVRDTFDRLRLTGIDPSDALGNFNHVMFFKRATGFSEIDPLKLIDGA